MSISGNAISIVGGTGYNLSATAPADGEVLSWNNTLTQWESSPAQEYTGHDGITINGSNEIRGLWSTSAADVILSNTTSNVAIGGAVDANYKLRVHGRFQSAGVNELSDERWKKDVTTLEGSLSKVLNLRGVNYSWKTGEFADKNFPEGKQFGFIAQEVEEFLPEAVDTDKDGYKSVQYSHMVAYLVEAIKEQQKMIENQQIQINALKAETFADGKGKQLENFETQLKAMELQIKNMQELMEASNTVGK